VNSPYKYYLEKIFDQRSDQQVVVQRDGAVDLKGKIEQVAEDGCTIAQPGSSAGAIFYVFVAYEDIRGIGHEDWDLSM
jgi:hypothetical protein